MPCTDSGRHECGTCTQEIHTCDGHVPLKIQLLWHVADAGSGRPSHAAIERNRANERFEEHRFAGGIRSKDRQRVSSFDAEAQIPEDTRLPKMNREVADLEHAFHVMAPS